MKKSGTCSRPAPRLRAPNARERLQSTCESRSAQSSIIEVAAMLRLLATLILLAAAAFGATQRLYLKDGDYQLVREYQVLADRVRYFSTERGDWEEIPLELVDLERTKKDVAALEESLKREAKEQDEEDAALRAERKEIANIPLEAGVYLIGEGKLTPLKQ